LATASAYTGMTFCPVWAASFRRSSTA
jgi:hypothetical protein